MRPNSPTLVRQCYIGATLDTLEEPYRTALTSTLNTTYAMGGLTDYQVTDLMLKAGLRSSDAAVNRHRGKRCICTQGRNTND